MKTEKALGMILAELERAEKLHPAWTRDVVKGCSLIAEESGEAIRAANNFDETKTGKAEIITEVVHTAAVALRFLKNMDDTDAPDRQ